MGDGRWLGFIDTTPKTPKTTFNLFADECPVKVSVLEQSFILIQTRFY